MSSLRRFSRTQKALASGLLAVGCATEERPPGPEIMGGEWVDNDTLRLRFSEPILDVAGVDPAKFRITSSGYYVDGTGTWYLDIGGYEDPPRRVDVKSLMNDPGDDAALLLDIDGTVDLVCERMAVWEQSPDLYSDIAFFPTYVSSPPPHIVNAEGGELEAFGAHWVLREKLFTIIDGFYPELDTDLGIPCPE